MKITEPKTPYVRYNAELDIVENMEDIPGLHLDRRNSNPPTPSSPAFNDTGPNASKTDGPQTVSPIAQTSDLPQASGSEERRASFAAKQRSSSTGSRSSSRSTSFHLPQEDLARLRRKNSAESDAAGGDDDELDLEARAKREAFLLARGRHYSKEAEAMKRAQELINKEEEDAEDSQGCMDVDFAAEGEPPRAGGSEVPLVPPLPNVNGVGH